MSTGTPGAPGPGPHRRGPAQLGLPEGLVDARSGVDRIGPRSRACALLQIRRQAARELADKLGKHVFCSIGAFVDHIRRHSAIRIWTETT